MKKKPYGVFLVHEIRCCKFWSVSREHYFECKPLIFMKCDNAIFDFLERRIIILSIFLYFLDTDFSISWAWLGEKSVFNQIVPLYLPALWLQNPTPLLHSTYFKPCPQWIIWPPTTVFAVVLGRSLFKVFVT